MYGLEKEDNKRKRFSFDLEKEIEASSAKKKELLTKAEERIQELKNVLREGSKQKDFDQVGVLLQGYTALQKVLKKVGK